jgi:adenosylcobinamide amidohydrolase
MVFTTQSPTILGNILYEDTMVNIKRCGRYIIAALQRPHRVLSTSVVGGGLREDCGWVVNHQSCEPNGHDEAIVHWQQHGPLGSHCLACEAVQLDPERTVLCGTAANMQCAALTVERHAELAVTVLATAGVEGNATRAGDPASWHENLDGCTQVQPHAGTIVHLVFINVPCTAGCLTKAATMLTEAKSCALLDLRIASQQSTGLATGTGTDQFALCAPLARSDEWERRFAGSHNTLGEILCRAVATATTRALEMQNGIVPSQRRSVLVALDRHGISFDGFSAVAKRELRLPVAELFRQNFASMNNDPPSAAIAHALATVLDTQAAGIFDRSTCVETIINHCALLSTVVAQKPDKYHTYRERLCVLSDRSPRNLIVSALVWGFADKWLDLKVKSEVQL